MINVAIYLFCTYLEVCSDDVINDRFYKYPHEEADKENIFYQNFTHIDCLYDANRYRTKGCLYKLTARSLRILRWGIDSW